MTVLSADRWIDGGRSTPSTNRAKVSLLTVAPSKASLNINTTGTLNPASVAPSGGLTATTSGGVISTGPLAPVVKPPRSEEHTSELQSQSNLVCRLLLEKKNSYGIHTSTRLNSSHSQISYAVFCLKK